jgi:hypothetical protein
LLLNCEFSWNLKKAQKKFGKNASVGHKNINHLFKTQHFMARFPAVLKMPFFQPI